MDEKNRTELLVRCFIVFRMDLYLKERIAVPFAILSFVKNNLFVFYE